MDQQIRNWKFWINDWDEEEGSYYPDEDYIFTGTWTEADLHAEELSDRWEDETGGFVGTVTIESQGKVKGASLSIGTVNMGDCSCTPTPILVWE